MVRPAEPWTCRIKSVHSEIYDNIYDVAKLVNIRSCIVLYCWKYCTEWMVTNLQHHVLPTVKKKWWSELTLCVYANWLIALQEWNSSDNRLCSIWTDKPSGIIPPVSVCIVTDWALIIVDNLLIREHGSVSLCRDGQKTKWRLQCKY